ncbi:MAG: tRNA 2-selenouridine(34) synthase MnmH [Pseudomonadota bacterium]
MNLNCLSDLTSHGYDAVIDVRSPSEHAEDHLPAAINLPVLSDAERARVGTIYVQDSPFRARKIGAALVARNAAHHIETALAGFDGGWRPLVYCWRGGQRSGSFASILSQIGWRAETVSGGYQRYRRLVVRALYKDPWPVSVVLLDGNTGTAKTDILAEVRRLGIQVLDLEGLAAHRGSVLGGRGVPQPAQKRFESGIAMALAKFDPARPVLIEAESNKVGERIIPPTLWHAMRDAPRIVIHADVPARAAYLARSYADVLADPAAVSNRLQALVPYHGRKVVDHWCEMLKAQEFTDLAAALIKAHYDPRYSKSRARHAGTVLADIAGRRLDPEGIRQTAAKVASELKRV